MPVVAHFQSPHAKDAAGHPTAYPPSPFSMTNVDDTVQDAPEVRSISGERCPPPQHHSFRSAGKLQLCLANAQGQSLSCWTPLLALKQFVDDTHKTFHITNDEQHHQIHQCHPLLFPVDVDDVVLGNPDFG